jgi:hypothetical protein
MTFEEFQPVKFFTSRSGFFTNILEVKNKGSLKNLNPLSLLGCALYSSNISRLLISFCLRILVANINLPAFFFKASVVLLLPVLTAFHIALEFGDELNACGFQQLFGQLWRDIALVSKHLAKQLLQQ